MYLKTFLNKLFLNALNSEQKKDFLYCATSFRIKKLNLHCGDPVNVNREEVNGKLDGCKIKIHVSVYSYKAFPVFLIY